MATNYECAFCHQLKYDTKVYKDFFGNTKTEWGDTGKDFMRCTNCGLIICKDCLTKMKNKKVGVFSTTFVCPTCGDKCIQISNKS